MQDVAVAIVGGGFSGLAAALELEAAGLRDWVILEGAERIGGTWRDNTYPGAACDVPSSLYSLSRALNPRWSRSYAPQAEILTYLDDVVERFDLGDRIELDCEVEEARWEDGWVVQTSRGEVRARHLLLGVGALREPAWPDLPGFEVVDGRPRTVFSGPVVHSARWPEGLRLQGKRVGLLGTGASAIQIGPAIVDRVEQLHVFQRTPPWVRPRRDHPISPSRQALYARLPLLPRLHRLATWSRLEGYYHLVFGPLHRHTGFVDRLVGQDMARRVPRDLRDQVVPDYRLGCKRVLLSDDWLPTLARPEVALHGGAEAITPEGVQVDGATVPLDVLVCCTGFTVSDPLGSLRIVGQHGVELGERWQERPSAYLGITVPDFPNLYTLLGPNTALGHSSVVVMIEAAARYAVQGILHAESEGAQVVDRQATEDFQAWVDRRHEGQVWRSGCRSWYNTGSGLNFTIWPGSTWSYLQATRRFDPTVYRSPGSGTSTGSSARG